MDFDSFLNQAWDEHAADAAGVAERLAPWAPAWSAKRRSSCRWPTWCTTSTANISAAGPTAAPCCSDWPRTPPAAPSGAARAALRRFQASLALCEGIGRRAPVDVGVRPHPRHRAGRRQPGRTRHGARRRAVQRSTGRRREGRPRRRRPHEPRPGRHGQQPGQHAGREGHPHARGTRPDDRGRAGRPPLLGAGRHLAGDRTRRIPPGDDLAAGR